MKNKNNLQDSENHNLVDLQRHLLSQIQRTHRFYLGEIIILLIYSILIGIFLVPFITYNVNELYLIPRVIIAFFFSIMSIVQIFRIWPYLREVGHYLELLRQIILNRNEEQEKSSQFIQSINGYLNKLYFLIFQRRKLKQKYLNYTSRQLSEELEKRLMLVMIGYAVMGIVIIFYCVYLLVDYSFILPNPIVYLSFIGIIISYSLLIIISLKTRKILSHWMAGYFDLKSWADNL